MGNQRWACHIRGLKSGICCDASTIDIERLGLHQIILLVIRKPATNLLESPKVTNLSQVTNTKMDAHGIWELNFELNHMGPLRLHVTVMWLSP